MIKGLSTTWTDAEGKEFHRQYLRCDVGCNNGNWKRSFIVMDLRDHDPQDRNTGRYVAAYGPVMGHTANVLNTEVANGRPSIL